MPSGRSLQVIEVTADANFAFDLFVIRSQVLVMDGPVFARAVVIPATKIALAETPGDGIPEHGFAAYAPSPFRESKPALPGLHEVGSVPAGKFVGQGVGVEVGAGVDGGAAFDQGDVHAPSGEMSRQGSAGRA